MDTNLFSSHFVVAFLFSIASVIVCIAQIILRKKINLLSVCRISTIFPLITVIINAMMGTAHAFYDYTKGLDLTSVKYTGISTILHSIALVLILTIINLIIYTITKSVYENTSKKK